MAILIRQRQILVLGFKDILRFNDQDRFVFTFDIDRSHSVLHYTVDVFGVFRHRSYTGLEP